MNGGRPAAGRRLLRESDSAFEHFSTALYRQSVTAGARLKTRLGPVFIGGSRAEGGRGRSYFSLGRTF